MLQLSMLRSAPDLQSRSRRESPCAETLLTLTSRYRQDLHDSPYTSRYDVEMELPMYEMPEQGVESKVVYQLLHDELMLGESSSPLHLPPTSSYGM